MRRKRHRFEIDERPEEILDLGKGDVLNQCAEAVRRQKPRTPAEIRHGLDRNGAGKAELMSQILPILDGFERVLNLAVDSGISTHPDFTNWFKSVEALHRRFRRALEKQGLEEIPSVGRPLDFDYHEVVEVQQHEDTPEAVIVAEEQKGYRLEDQVLRGAKVVVSQPRKNGSEGVLGANTKGEGAN